LKHDVAESARSALEQVEDSAGHAREGASIRPRGRLIAEAADRGGPTRLVETS
jgi:hypothetical protein